MYALTSTAYLEEARFGGPRKVKTFLRFQDAVEAGSTQAGFFSSGIPLSRTPHDSKRVVVPARKESDALY